MIELKHVTKVFDKHGGRFEALSDVSLKIEDGDIYGIIGMSGAGKSTLVRCINMLERPTEGSVEIDGVNLGTLSKKELREVRRNVTMIFQNFNLLMQRTCLKNICFPLELAGVKKAEAKQRALELLEIVGLSDKANAYPAQLSGGQQQRIAIARALATKPKILLCDEATSALDPKTTQSILSLIREINAKLGITVVIITHQMSVVESVCRHVAILDGGRVAEQGDVSTIFAKPRSDAARHLVFPEGESVPVVSRSTGERFIRLVFNGASATGEPLIAKLALEKGICANIANASTRNIGEGIYGSMLLGISGGYSEIAAALEYCNSFSGVLAQEVNIDVQ